MLTNSDLDRLERDTLIDLLIMTHDGVEGLPIRLRRRVLDHWIPAYREALGVLEEWKQREEVEDA